MGVGTAAVAEPSTVLPDNEVRGKRRVTDAAALVPRIADAIFSCIKSSNTSNCDTVQALIGGIQRMDRKVICSVAAMSQVRERLLRGLDGSFGLEVQQHAAGIVAVLTLQAGSAAWQGGDSGLEAIISTLGSLLEPHCAATPKAKERAARVLACLSKEEVTGSCLPALLRRAAQRLTLSNRQLSTWLAWGGPVGCASQYPDPPSNPQTLCACSGGDGLSVMRWGCRIDLGLPPR